MDAPAIEGRITRAEIVSASIPLRRQLQCPPRPVATPLLARDILWLRLRGDDEVEGIGEASTVDWLSPRSHAGTRCELEAIAAQIGQTRPYAAQLLERSLDPALSSTARAGLQCALLDLEARRRGVSLARLLGAPCEATLAVSALLSGNEALAAGEAAQYARLGFRSVKLKIGRGRVTADISHVLDVRAAAGPAVRLRLDANGAWRAPEASAALRALATAGVVDFIEEPLAHHSPRRLELLRELRTHMRVAVDESIVCGDDLEAVIAEKAADVLVIKLERVGGPLPALALAALANRGGLRVVFTDSIESLVGRAATAHVAHAAGCSEAIGLGGAFLLDRRTETQGVVPHREHGADQAAALSAAAQHIFTIRGPGLGVELARHGH